METHNPPSGTRNEHPPEERERRGGTIADVFEREYTDPLAGENFEDTAAVLDRLLEVQKFRKALAGHPFASFYELTEAITKISQRGTTKGAKQRGIKKVIENMGDRVAHLSPRVADLFQALLASLGEETYKPRFEETRKQMSRLTEVKDQRSDLDILFAEDVSWDLKLNRIQNVLDGYLAGMRALDRREGKHMNPDVRRWREEQLRKDSGEPAEQRNESKPGVDPMKRLKEGEQAKAIWSIHPAWGGIYREQSFTIWDEESKSWKGERQVYSDVPSVPLSNNADDKKGPIDIVLTASIHTGVWHPVPSSYKHGFHAMDAKGKAWKVKQNQRGDLFVSVSGEGEPVTIKVMFGPDTRKKYTSQDPSRIKVPDMQAEFSEATQMALQEIGTEYKGNIARALAIKRYVTKSVQYLAPKDRAEAEHYNTIYRTSPKGFSGAVDELKKGDCDVVNTYFAALCAQLNIPVRHCVGHSVKGRDDSGNAVIHSGTGHAWSEVWDELKREWKDVDSTPPGDPNLEPNSEQEDAAPGYFGEQEAVGLTDEELEDLRKKLAEHKNKLSYTRDERDLAQATGIELREAREITREIATAEKTCLPNGRRVVDLLSALFNAIVESRKVVQPQNSGLVRKAEGGTRIKSLPRHKIGIVGGESDPSSRERAHSEEEDELSFGGFDVFIVGDKSGSMSLTDEQGEALWSVQRRAEYLIFSALHRFEQAIERAGIPSEEGLGVRSQGISFRGSAANEIDLDKPLSGKFAPADKVKMWHSLSNQGGGNGDVAALNYIYGQILDEIKKDKEGTRKKRLRLVIACSDGGPDNPVELHKYAEALGRLGVLVVGIGLTKTASSVPEIYTTEFSRGDIVHDINDLPLVIAKHLVEEAIRLFPAHTRADSQSLIDEVLAEFKRV